MIGQMVGNYRIVEKLGTGGMGVVYKAEDVRLRRPVALKFLPEAFAADPQTRERFQREARAASSLNHPNIATIFDVGEQDGRPFIVMEFLEGQTLKEWIASGPIRPAEILDFAIQITEGLTAAHEKGIVHRDVKPANVFVTAQQQVKLLDFGLAKLEYDSPPALNSFTTRSNTPDLTAPGTTVGTMSYMSPEQARGEPLDVRTDLFSFGVVLYEMAAQTPPFKGNTVATLFDAILNQEPTPVHRFNPEIPMELERIIHKALEKDRALRYLTAADARADLKRLKREMDSGSLRVQPESVPEPRDSTWRWLGFASAGLLALLIWKSGLLKTQTSADRAANGISDQWTFTQATNQEGLELHPSLSPDGRSLVFASAGDIYFLRVGGQNPVNLTRDSPLNDDQPQFSPDGERIAFRSDRDGGGVFVMGATGESAKRLTTFGFNPAWSPDGREIAFSVEPVGTLPSNRASLETAGLWIVDVGTGKTRELGHFDAVQPSWSPNGHRIAYWSNERDNKRSGQRDLWTVRPDGTDRVSVTNDAALDWNPVWSADGKYLFFSSDRGGTLNWWRVAIDEVTGLIHGAMEPVTRGSSASQMHLSIAKDGKRMAFAEVSSSLNIFRLELDPVTHKTRGTPVSLTQGSHLYGGFGRPAVSPDGQWLVFTSTSSKEDITLLRTDGSGLRQLTDDDAKDRWPTWSPDGQRIAFYSSRAGSWEIYTINRDGSDLRALTEGGTTSRLFPLWAPDGSRITMSTEAGCYFIDPALRANEQKLIPVSPDGRQEDCFRLTSWSPDGKWIVGLGVGGGDGDGLLFSTEKRQFTSFDVHGGLPFWLKDSRQIIFVSEGKMFTLDTVSKKLIEVSSVPPNFTLSAISTDNTAAYGTVYTQSADIWVMTRE